MNQFQLLLLLCFLILNNNKATAQEIKAAPSPTAANLGVYGEIPVSHFTGTPSIEIPLYELGNKGVKIPLSLSYHPGGIRPLLHPGPTGLGWSLRVGGVITREIKGEFPDEYSNVWSSPTTFPSKGYYHHGSMLTSGDWKTFFERKSCDELNEFLDNFKDLEPDEFNFSFPGVSGKFYLSPDGQFRVQCDRPVKVEFSPSDFVDPKTLGMRQSERHTKTFGKFTLTDEWGNKYIYGNGAIEFSCKISMDVVQEELSLFATSWFLKEVIPADGSESFSFEYEKGPIISQLFDSYANINIQVYSGGDTWPRIRYNGSSKIGNFIFPVYLKKIHLPNNASILFSYSKSNELNYSKYDYSDLGMKDEYGRPIGVPFENFTFQMVASYDIDYYKTHQLWNNYLRIEWLKLDTIQVSSPNGITKKIHFSYLDNPSSRLFLENLTIYGDKATEINPLKYLFEYKDRDKLTYYYRTYTDHWGFCSGRQDIPGGESDGDVNSNYNQSGILSKIVYPTGGSSSFFYESNTADKVVDKRDRTIVRQNSNLGLIGGVRIKEIKSNDSLGNETVKRFHYSPDFFENSLSEKSSGILNVEPEYIISSNGQRIPNCYKGESFTISDQRSVPIIPLTNSNGGNFIGYTTVTESLVNGSETEGYKQYIFSNHDNGYNDDSSVRSWNNTYFWNIPHCSRYFERGKILREISYTKNKSKVMEKKYDWTRIGSKDENENVRALQYGCFLNDSYLSLFSSNAYLNYVYKFVLSKEENVQYDLQTGATISKMTTYNYNNLGLLIEALTTNSDLAILKTAYKYPTDFKSSYPYNEMVTRNILSPVIEKSEYRNNTLLNKELTEYSSPYANLYLPARSMFQVGYNALEERATYLYDSKGNTREVMKDQGADKTVYLWGYNHQYPIAEIKGASYEEVKAAIAGNEATINTLGASLTPDMTKVDALRSSMPRALVTTYTYKPLVGISLKTDPRGVKTLYDYDTFGRLIQVKLNDKVIQQYQYNYKNN